MQPEILRELKDYDKRIAKLESYDKSSPISGSSFPTDNLYNGRPFNYNGTTYAHAWYEYRTDFLNGSNWYRLDKGHEDSFTHADSATTMGSTQDNYAWNALLGVWGISSNQAYSVTDTDGRLVILDSYQMTNPTIQVAVSGTLNGNYRLPDVAFRMLDSNNYLEAQLFGGQVYLEKWDAGVNTALTNVATTTTNGVTYTLTIVCSGLNVSIYVDGVLKINNYLLTGTDIKYAGYTKMGFLLKKTGAPGTAARWDNFIAKQVAA